MIIGLVLVIVTVVLVFVGRKQWKKYSLIKNIPTTPVAELFEGQAEVKGNVVELTDQLTSPLSQKPCVAFKFIVEEERTRRDKDGDTRRSWHTVVNDKESVVFGVDDGTGIAAVDLKKAELILDMDSRMRSGTFNDAPAHVEGLLSERYGRSTKSWVFNKTMRYKEFVLEAGDPLYVLGNVKRPTPDDAPMFYKGDIPFIVTDKGEKTLLRNTMAAAMGCFIAAVAVLAVAIYLIQQAMTATP